ncbi:transcriptional repressor LexA [Aerococcaceae bacterium NML191292]|nr:transcriptional repressor LexA [Aerococcaceae bacterium NML191292]MCW6663639.1 transcriptional repressor LexA [Aerococcaceae bacterium NML190073]MCW6677008.1 transcriptional repressor LexA [Aerococcaceae bacterium NML180378]MDO4774651.1 transcriptional repressor LexA [Aerococcaceae bacterium]
MNSLSNKQLNILKCIYDAIENQGYPPTVREIGASSGLSSTSTVHGHLERLEKAGYIIRDSSKTRAIELSKAALDVLGVSPKEIPVLGRVAAGMPILAVEEATDFYPIPPDVHYDPSELFMLEIQGESMVNIGIMDGDLITVRRQPSANNGDVVIAMTAEDEVTCKTFFRKSDHFVLRPENDSMEDIILNDVTILGKVVSLYRRF